MTYSVPHPWIQDQRFLQRSTSVTRFREKWFDYFWVSRKGVSVELIPVSFFLDPHKWHERANSIEIQ